MLTKNMCVSSSSETVAPYARAFRSGCQHHREHESERHGLIAEEVEKVDANLVYRNNKGQVESVRYEMVNAMLVNEFLKEHRKNEEQQATITALKSNDAKQEATIARQEKQIEALTAGLQKVSAQLELSKPEPQTALNNR